MTDSVLVTAASRGIGLCKCLVIGGLVQPCDGKNRDGKMIADNDLCASTRWTCVAFVKPAMARVDSLDHGRRIR